MPIDRKIIEKYKLQYHDAHTEMDEWVLELPKIKFVKKGLQEGVKRAKKKIGNFK